MATDPGQTIVVYTAEPDSALEALNRVAEWSEQPIVPLPERRR